MHPIVHLSVNHVCPLLIVCACLSAQESVDEWQEEEEVQVDLSDLNIKELPQPEERAGAGQTLDADGNPTGPGQAGVWNRNKDRGERRD